MPLPARIRANRRKFEDAERGDRRVNQIVHFFFNVRSQFVLPFTILLHPFTFVEILEFIFFLKRKRKSKQRSSTHRFQSSSNLLIKNAIEQIDPNAHHRGKPQMRIKAELRPSASTQGYGVRDSVQEERRERAIVDLEESVSVTKPRSLGSFPRRRGTVIRPTRIA